MTYQITFKKSAIKDLLNFPPKDVKQIILKIDNLGIEPRPKGCKKLESMAGLWRIRVGNYRVIYLIDDVIRIVEINESDIERIYIRHPFIMTSKLTKFS